MELADEILDKLEELEREIDKRDYKRSLTIHVYQPVRKKRPVAGFPFSLIEQLLNGVLNATGRAVDRLVRWIERRFT